MNSKRNSDIRRITGKDLKEKAKPTGNFVPVEIDNVYELCQVMGEFFYGKKHEWIAVCFLDENFRCKLIWFNKGADHRSVPLLITPGEAISIAKSNHLKYLIIMHNHPLSSKIIPDYGSRRRNIEARYFYKEQLRDFSGADKAAARFWSDSLKMEGIGYADVVFVAGDYRIEGDKEIIDNLKSNRPFLEKLGTSGGCLSWTLLISISIVCVALGIILK